MRNEASGPPGSPRSAALLLLALVLLASLSTGCGEDSPAPAPPPSAPPSALDRLLSWMTGSFSSAEQAAADPDYLDIRLEMAPIWTERSDGRWLYVEQALAAARERPYRQRVYQVVPVGGDRFESRVFELPDPLRFAGAWKEAAPLAALSPADLVAREGCTVHLTAAGDGTFAGATEGNGCASTLRGAAYATSEVTIDAQVLRSWDRGYDAAGAQIWGAEKGPYVFRRVPAAGGAASTTAAPAGAPAEGGGR